VLNWQDRDTATFLMGGIRKLAEDSGVVFLKIDPDLGAEEEEEVELLGELGFLEQDTGADFGGVQPKYVMRLDLRGRDKDELLADFHSKTRYNIRYAYRKGIDVNTSCEREQLDAFYELLQITAERDEFGIRSYDYFVYIWEHIIRPGLGKLVVAEHDGQPLAGAIAFRNGPRVWYVYGASSNEKRNLMPTYAVQWELICWAKELGCHTYDFRGVSGDLDPDNPLYGLYRFKKGFDAKMFELAGEFDLVYSTPWYWFWNTMEPLYRRFRSTFSDWLN
jgi:lipid II:glycine glycyltransferase (peptidoglycan interpeptide bridge formation enzyme)